MFDTQLQKTIGLAIKMARESKGISQNELVERMNTTRLYVRTAEQGHMAFNVETLLRFSIALEIQAWKLLRWVERYKEIPEEAIQLKLSLEEPTPLPPCNANLVRARQRRWA
jgi:transcriptional regulator with XRE-family HTH domain